MQGGPQKRTEKTEDEQSEEDEEDKKVEEDKEMLIGGLWEDNGQSIKERRG